MLSHLRNKILLGSLGLIALLGLGLLIPVRSTVRNLLVEEIQKRGNSLARHLAEEAVKPLRADDREALSRYVKEYGTSMEGVLYVFVRNAAGSVLVHNFADSVPPELLLSLESPLNPDRSMRIVPVADKAAFDISAPIDGGALGTTHIGFSKDAADRAVFRVTVYVASVIGAVLIFGAFIASLFAHAITEPLGELTEMASQVGQGNLEYFVKPKTRDELGQLAVAFNEMAAGLRDSTRQLIEANNELEQEIAERIAIQQELDHTIQFMNSLYDSIRDPFVVLDRSFTIVRVNEAYAEMKNLSVPELLGNTCYRCVGRQEGVCDGCVVEKTFRSQDPCAKEKSVRYGDGSEGWVMIYTYPVLDENGVVTHVIEYTHDITEIRKGDEERKNLIRELQYLSRTDGLTGLCNHRTIIERLVYETRRARRYETELSIVLCDMDNFKAINDEHGHHVGDKVIQAVGSALAEAVRTPDILGRYGGDEFLLILPETGVAGAMELAERIRQAVESTTVEFAGGHERIGVTVSVGVVSYGGEEDTDSLIQRVDSALYSSKREGKNRVFSA